MSEYKTRVLLADDHAIVRAGLRALIESIADVQVVAEAGNGAEAVQLARQLRPDVALLDIAMPQLGGIEAAARIARESPATKVVMLSMHNSSPYVTAALRAGAVGYVIKEAAVDELATALRTVVSGGSYLSPAVSGHLVQQLRQPKAEAASGWLVLSSRQREILQLIAEGRSTRAIGELLHISPKTVETHRAELMRRLNIFDVAGLTRFALREGLLADAA